MNVQFLGTCACDFRPELKTIYRDCFDKDARRSTSVLIDGELLLDCGLWTSECLRLAETDVSAIQALFVSHSHVDHFETESLRKVAAQCTKPLAIYCDRAAAYRAEGVEHVEVHTLTPFVPIEVLGWKITPLSANHYVSDEEQPLHYLLEKNGKKIFYGCDGGWYPTRTGLFLYEKEIDLFIMDCTVGDYSEDRRAFVHNSIPMARELAAALRTHGGIAKDGQIWLCHLAPSLHKSHTETVEIAAKDDLHVAYDGLTLTI